MWPVEQPNGKTKFVMDYKDPYTGRKKYVAVTMNKNTKQTENQASTILKDKVKEKLKDSPVTENIKFIDLLEDWWKFYKKGIKQSSISSLNSSVKKLRLLFDKETIISNITTKYIQKRLINFDTTHGSKERMKSMLNLMFDYAVDNNLLQINPSRNVKLPRKIITIKEYESVTKKYLEREELELLIGELRQTKKTYRIALLAEFMSLNGCRIGEAIAIKKENYNKKEKTVDIHGTLDKTVGYRLGSKTTPKTIASYRTVSLSKREIEILDEFIELNEYTKMTNSKYQDMNFIFVSKNGIPLANNSFNLAIQKANSRLNNPINKNLSSHIFRHSLISYLSEKGIPLEAIKARVGHSDGSKTTEKIYTHVTKSMKQDITKLLDEIDNKHSRKVK
ncbi:integrase [Floricoccus penangensis]|uniref:Integrase n=2 Tax=Floricoccus penangensis TaxID=1859475 RepID=A0A9Q5JHA6_9LACT|nr:integrase [Floricoccus penangensis]